MPQHTVTWEAKFSEFDCAYPTPGWVLNGCWDSGKHQDMDAGVEKCRLRCERAGAGPVMRPGPRGFSCSGLSSNHSESQKS